jgi:hypothetical protein
MKYAKLILAALLATAGVASADPYSYRHHRVHEERERDVVGTERLDEGRGTAIFRVTPEMRRDGLQLSTNMPGLRIISVDFGYSDGRVVRLPGRQLRGIQDGLLTIQTGRPPGLRTVRVRYLNDVRYGTGVLQLVQLHTGDGYTHDEDLWQNRDPDHDGDDDVDGGYRVDHHRGGYRR